MKRGENIVIQNARLTSENVRLTNKVSAQEDYICSLEEDMNQLREEILELQKERQSLLQENEELRSSLCNLQDMHSAAMEKYKATEELLEEASAANVDFHSVIRMLQFRTFNHNSDASRYLDGELPCDVWNGDDLWTMVRDLSKRLRSSDAETHHPDTPLISCGKNAEPAKVEEDHPKAKRHRNVWSAPVLEKYGIDTTNLPEGAKLIHRKEKDSGCDVWLVRTLEYTPAQCGAREYLIGRFNVPNEDPMSSRKPRTLIDGNPLLPSFIRFYLVSKFVFNMSESKILEMLRQMHTDIPQSTLNGWMHDIMGIMRERLMGPMLEELRKSTYVQNDETRILVRSRSSEEDQFAYHTEYIHGSLSTERRVVVFLYKDGSRSHDVQLEHIFKGSSINTFTSDRASLYRAIESEMSDFRIVRSSCWFHLRHRLADAYITDKRITDLLNAVNALFRLEDAIKDKSIEERYRLRQRYSKPLVNSLINRMKQIRKSGKYGLLVMRAVNYLLEDEMSFRRFLSDGRIEMHNNAAERMFRHIAMGRRNWLHTGSHKAAENIAFVFSLYESCRLNDLDFGEYIEDILTRMMNGDADYASMIPCNYQQRAHSVSKSA